ncbi:hypothetical protein FC52_GL000639 [Lactobacillus pasteurii DSM 23907 = CRBIP 24.76]|nr:hypothetical protein FC52_GL000639 [Lactobacillus pasteurii DSM 23907 = CRBIP 24.76]
MYYSIGGEVYFEGFFMKKNTIYKAALALLLLAGTNSTPVLADETTSQKPAVIMMLNFAGVHISKTKAAAVMPRSSNPNRGFIGSPYKAYPLGYLVAPNGVKPVVKRYLGKAVNMTGYPISALKQKLLKSHLVVVWVGAFDTFSNHALTLTGYKGSTLFYNDPWTGKKASISEASFRVHWALDAYRALSY